MQTLNRIVALAGTVLLATATLAAQTETVSGVIGNGGGIATGGGSVLIGTVGQPALGMGTGDGGSVLGGFWGQPFATLTAIDEPGAPLLPAVYRLDQNFPNPFNPSTVIQYQLPKEAHVSLRVYDVVGRLVTTLVDGVQEAGFRSVTLDGRNLASGVYFYRLHAEVSGGGKDFSFEM